jgi:hypothetical protein
MPLMCKPLRYVTSEVSVAQSYMLPQIVSVVSRSNSRAANPTPSDQFSPKDQRFDPVQQPYRRISNCLITLIWNKVRA